MDITKLLADLHKLKRGERLGQPMVHSNEQEAGAAGGQDKENLPRLEGGAGGQEVEEQELVARRERQVAAFKRTEDYKVYCATVTREQRTGRMPR